MTFRKTLLTAAVAVSAAALTGCPGNGGTDGGPQDAGCTGICNQQDSGSNQDAGGGQDAGQDAGVCTLPGVGTPPSNATTIAQVRAQIDSGDGGLILPLYNVVVTQVEDEFNTTSGGATGEEAFFWVVDPSAPTNGIWVEKFTADYGQDCTASVDNNYTPQVGDVLEIRGGYAAKRPGNRFNSLGSAYRDMINDGYPAVKNNNVQFVLLDQDAGFVPADNGVDAGFGNSQGGTVAANPELAGVRVHIPGPLTITNANPPALTRYQSNSYPPVAAGFNGFEVGTDLTGIPFGGILVSDNQTYQTFFQDGGAEPGRCDWAAAVRDGGTVSFPNGISGVWDTYSTFPCTGPTPDGGKFCPNGNGVVPQADGGTAPGPIYILWPSGCSDFPGGIGL